MFLYGPWLALRSRHPCFFTGANPSIKAGGLGLESKFATLELLPAAVRPNSLLVLPGQSLEQVQLQLMAQGITYPLVAKPDIGYRGFLVQKISTPEQLTDYLQRYQIPVILQEFLAHPTEIGVLYFKLPGAGRGQISSLTFKEFLHVRGDGVSAVVDLIKKNPRALLQWERLQRTCTAAELARIPANGEKVQLGEIGNHSKGTAFINGNAAITPALLRTFDALCANIPGFNYGRFDLKCGSLADLEAGVNFKVIELNGIGAEPTHIYDQNKTTYWGALGTIMWHWEIIRRIAKANHQRGQPYWKPKAMLQALWDLHQYHQNIKRQTTTG